MATQTVSAAISKTIEARFSRGVQDGLTEVSEDFADIQNSIEVSRGEIGQSWKAIHTFITSVAGNLKATGAMGGDSFNEDSRSYNVHGAPSTFPTVAGGVSPGYVQREITLQEWMGNMFIPLEFAKADQLTASIGKAVAAVIKQTARMVAQIRANVFWAYDATNKFFAQGDASTGPTTSGASITYTLGVATRIRAAQPGMVLDIYDSTGATKKNSTQTMIVETVDPLGFTMTLTTSDGSNYAGTAAANNDQFCLVSSKGNGPKGPLYWLAASGTVFNLALATYPQHKALVKAVSASLTENTLQGLLLGYVSTHGKSWAPNRVLMTEGVLNEYLYQQVGGAAGGSTSATYPARSAQQYDRTGKPLQYVGGYRADQMKILIGGKEYDFATNDLMPAGYCIATKWRNNIVRYVPPRAAGPGGATGSDPQFADIEFIAKWGGESRSIWKHAYASSATTKFLEAPFLINEEYAPNQLGGIVCTGCTENILYA